LVGLASLLEGQRINKGFYFQIGFSGMFLKRLHSSSPPHQNWQPRSDFGSMGIAVFANTQAAPLLVFMDLPS